jgi:hypothetical protein
VDVKLLGIYLNDHLAGSNAGVELARRAQRENPDNAVGRYLVTFIKELEDERTVLQQVMRALGVTRNEVKHLAGWVMEKVARLKANGRLVRYSPLSRMVELEALTIAVIGKRCLWALLERHAKNDRRLAGFDFATLIAQAEDQHRTLDRLRLQASDTAFVKAPLPVGMATPIEETGAR